ncbi:MAG: endonuclease [Burkholderiales bacterium]|nr:endonuclease [Flavobacterium sp.]
MKKHYALIFLFFVSIGIAQPPAGYYNTATSSGYVLKTQLYNIIKGHNDRGYSGLYVTYTTSDKDFYYENDGTMLDVYSENPTGPECEFTYGINQDDGTLGNNECERYNREHTIPQSVFGSATPMYSDAHFVLPSDKHVNAVRGDLPFGKVNVANFTSTNGTKRGSNLNSGYSSGYAASVFEPIDEFKGDIARCLLYFATRYETQVTGWNYTMFNGTSTQVFTPTFLNILLTWNQIDPVSQREIARNNAIYARQGNRNPYIDNNIYVTSIWGAPLATNTFEDLNAVSIYPNPTSIHKVTIESETTIDEIKLINVNGQLMQQIKNPIPQNHSYVIDNLPQGFYFVTLTINNQVITKKIIVN